MLRVEFRSSATEEGDEFRGDDIRPSYPADIQDGDVALMVVTIVGDHADIGTPAGWVEETGSAFTDDLDVFGAARVFRRVCDGTESGDRVAPGMTVTGTAGTDPYQFQSSIAVYYNVDRAFPTRQRGARQDNATDLYTLPCTPDNDNDALVHLYGVKTFTADGDPTLDCENTRALSHSTSRQVTTAIGDDHIAVANSGLMTLAAARFGLAFHVWLKTATPPPPDTGGLGGPNILTGRSEPPVSARWRWFICDRSGNRVMTLTRLAKERKVMIRRNRPSSFVFTVPSDDPQMQVRLGDGQPILAKQYRTVKGYRYEDANGYPVEAPNGTWVIRFAGIVWQIQDKGDIDGHAFSTVTCVSPLAMLAKMPLATGTPGQRQHLIFDSIDAGEIIVTLIDNANTDAGFTP